MIVYAAAEEKAWAVGFGMRALRDLDLRDYPLSGDSAGDLFEWPGLVGERNLEGPLSICVPTQLAGLAAALDRVGSRPLAELMGPAVALAREGLGIDWYASLLIGKAARQLARYPASGAVWLPDGSPAPDWQGKTGVLPLDRLGDALDEVAHEGAAGFYRGALARRIVENVQRLGGGLQLADMEGIRPRPTEALAIPYRDASVFAMLGLFAGVTLRGCLKMLSHESLGGEAPDGDAYGAYAETLNAAYAERLEQLGDSAPGPSCTSHLRVVGPAEQHGVPLADAALALRQQGPAAVDRPAHEQRGDVVRPAAWAPELDRRRQAAALEHVPGDRALRAQSVRPRCLGRTTHPAGRPAAHELPGRLWDGPRNGLPPTARRCERHRLGDGRTATAGVDQGGVGRTSGDGGSQNGRLSPQLRLPVRRDAPCGHGHQLGRGRALPASGGRAGRAPSKSKTSREKHAPWAR